MYAQQQQPVTSLKHLLCCQSVRTLAFVASRRMSEVILTYVHERLPPALRTKLCVYRGGYTKEERGENHLTNKPYYTIQTL